jgi:hypothetical protein
MPLPKILTTQFDAVKPTLIKTGLILVGFIATYYLGTCGNNPSKYEAEIKQWQDSTASIVQKNSATNKVVDSLIKKNASIEKTLALNSIEVTRLENAAKKLHVPTKTVDSIIVAAPDTCKPLSLLLGKVVHERDTLLVTIDTLHSEGVQRKVQNFILLQAVDSLRRENGILTYQLLTVPVYHEPEFLKFIPLPSRKASFGIGFIMGAGSTVATAIIVNNLKR